MLTFIAHNWKFYALRGLLAVVFGVAALLWPGLTLGVLVVLFGVYALLEGILAVAAALSNRSEKFWGLLFLEGVAGIAAGLLAFIWPSLTAVILLVFIAVWAIFTGVLEIAAAVRLRKEMTGEWLLGLAGVLSVLIGVLLIANPLAGALAVVWLIGLYAVLFGALLLFLGFKARRYQLQ